VPRNVKTTEKTEENFILLPLSNFGYLRLQSFLKMRNYLLLLLHMIVLGMSCNTTRPCHEGGDTSWDPPLKGDGFCLQREVSDGVYQNHGNYQVLDTRTQRVLLDGRFVEGKKDGVWTEYNEQGEPIREKYFEKGIEKARPPLPSNPPSKR
jgi:hypothetical protein